MGGNSSSKAEKKAKKAKKSGKTPATTPAVEVVQDPKVSPRQPQEQKVEKPEAKETPQETKEDHLEDLKKTDEVEKVDDYVELYNSSQKKVTQDDFDLVRVIGRGSFGKVMLVQKKDDKKYYAMKILRKDVVKERKQVDHTKAEKTVLMQISHPFIVKLYYAFQTADKLYMILEFVNGGELFHHLKEENSFSEERSKFYAAEIALVLIHLHSLDIIYRDLKPENILLDNTGNVVITDFGLSKQLAEGQDTSTFCGTPDYLAPEILKGTGHGAAVDWWSLGILIYEMIVGIPPFYDDDVSIMYQKILKSQPHFPKNISYDAKSVIMGLLEKDPNDRLEGKDVIEMEWFKDIDFDKLLKKEVPPPWVPPVKSKTEISQIDEEFIDEDAVDTPPNEGNTNNPDNTFEGFTFVQPNAMGEEQ
ncbi:protein kinase, putative [Entamoeba invadens IP1]|uniref:non-specific serine/threonine protein kinase n=2 Tax=Entamoeba invadens TaxID=33085 RepID=L7FMU8_ENTIV|nr:protein kinase, putative [Entamoeba invadens IP1]ELP92263.1 protein kinase, putative [Entamoeba invadens IP1]BAN41937.1 protein kinase, putative [Entamoeba invadens]|eukprot:XP_004259034.1 protein kinase, putative [Entamoeba invadens IP1]